MPDTVLRALLHADHWRMAHGYAGTAPFILRFREPLPGPVDVPGYDRVLRVLWAFAEEDLDAMPDDDTCRALASFEDDLCGALEQDLTAALMAVLTFDGARQWVFYTRDLAACGQRINALPQKEDPYPLELDSFIDREWRYVRDLLSRHVPAV